jgi:hypothetical protein
MQTNIRPNIQNDRGTKLLEKVREKLDFLFFKPPTNKQLVSDYRTRVILQTSLIELVQHQRSALFEPEHRLHYDGLEYCRSKSGREPFSKLSLDNGNRRHGFFNTA